MINNYYWDHKRILNENDSQAISSSQFIVNRKSHKRSTFSMFQNAFIGYVAVNIYGSRNALVWQQCSEHVSVEYTIKLPYKFI